MIPPSRAIFDGFSSTSATIKRSPCICIEATEEAEEKNGPLTNGLKEFKVVKYR